MEPDTNPTPIERVEQAIEHVAEEVVAEVKSIAHTIEHRCFGRASPDEPMKVTTTTGN